MYRFALIYFLLYVGLGTYVPWMPPFLESRGMSAAAIGMALASVQLARAVLPPAWGFLADRLHLRRGLFIASTLAAAASLLSLTLPGGASSLTARLALYGAVVVPAMPLLETLTLAGLKGERQRYGPVRLWGSIGFIVSAWGVGSLVPAVGVALVPWACALPLLLGAGWAVAALPRAPAAPLHQSPRLSELPWAELMPMVAAAAMTQMSHGPYYAFFTLELGERGVSPMIIGGLWAIGVLAEILFMAVSPRWLPRLGPRNVLRWAVLVTAARWLVLGGTDSLWLIGASQLLHAASYAAVHLATVQLVDAVTPEHSKATAQSLLSAGVWGLGIGTGLAAAGQGLAPLGYDGIYLAAAAVALVGYLPALAASRGRA